MECLVHLLDEISTYRRRNGNSGDIRDVGLATIPRATTKRDIDVHNLTKRASQSQAIMEENDRRGLQRTGCREWEVDPVPQARQQRDRRMFERFDG